MNMNNQLLHTPEGVRDIYAEEYARKLAVEQKIQHVFSLYGYQSIESEEAWEARACTSFLTGITTRWFCGRI